MAGAAALAGLPAYAQPYQPPYQQPYQPTQPYQQPASNGLTPLGASGAWSVVQVTTGAGACLLGTPGPNGGMLFIGTAGGNQVLTLGFDKPSWNIPASAAPSVTFQVDNYPPVNTTPTKATYATGMSFSINADFMRDFIHEVTSGSTLTVRFSGSEPPWTVSLAGTTAVWAPFMHCAESVAPSFVATLNQQYTPYAPSQTYAGTPQPYVAAPQPYVAAPQPYTAPYAPPPHAPQMVSQPLQLDGGVFTLPATIGTRTFTFALDTGSSVVAVPEDVARMLERDGVLTVTGSGKVVLADGSKVAIRNGILGSVTVGGITVNNVECEITSKGSPLLLGQSWMHKFKSVGIDYASNSLNIRV